MDAAGEAADRNSLIAELEQAGIKHIPDDILRIAKAVNSSVDARHQPVELERSQRSSRPDSIGKHHQPTQAKAVDSPKS